MERLVRIAAWLVRAFWRAYGRKWHFLTLFLLALFVTLIMLARFDLLPEAPKPADAADLVGPPAAVSVPELPERIQIPAIGLSAAISNPESADIQVLDSLLLHGAVRYPFSARLGEEGNVVLFGHSSYLPVVKNPAYRTFNDIQKLRDGDTITLYSSQNAYVYRVKAVRKENSEIAAIPLSVAGRMLTLSTCDSFGKKSDRFVVEAELVGSRVLSD